jgi:hypothetical protein
LYLGSERCGSGELGLGDEDDPFPLLLEPELLLPPADSNKRPNRLRSGFSSTGTGAGFFGVSTITGVGFSAVPFASTGLGLAVPEVGVSRFTVFGAALSLPIGCLSSGNAPLPLFTPPSPLPGVEAVSRGILPLPGLTFGIGFVTGVWLKSLVLSTITGRGLGGMFTKPWS